MILDCRVWLPDHDDRLFPPGGYRLGRATVAGNESFHAEAIAVTTDESGVHHAVVPEYESRIDALEIEHETRFATMKLPGSDRDWVLLITPMGD
ncbi:MAG: hypothetical protein WAZ94_15045 [Phycisphaerales bacterium]|nr:hypothetical protein [Chloroflexota bacterium]